MTGPYLASGAHRYGRRCPHSGHRQYYRGTIKQRHFTGVFAVFMGVVALLATILHGMEGMVWAAAYRLLGALPDIHSAVLYSLSAITMPVQGRQLPD